jgi:hypothetical protein
MNAIYNLKRSYLNIGKLKHIDYNSDIRFSKQTKGDETVGTFTKEFNETVLESLQKNNISKREFAKKMKLSIPYIYDLFKRRDGRRWNEDTINKACEILDLEIKFNKKEVS